MLPFVVNKDVYINPADQWPMVTDVLYPSSLWSVFATFSRHTIKYVFFPYFHRHFSTRDCHIAFWHLHPVMALECYRCCLIALRNTDMRNFREVFGLSVTWTFDILNWNWTSLTHALGNVHTTPIFISCTLFCFLQVRISRCGTDGRTRSVMRPIQDGRIRHGNPGFVLSSGYVTRGHP